MSNGYALLAIHNFSKLKSLANNAKIRPSLQFLLITYVYSIYACGIFSVDLDINQKYLTVNLLK